MSLRRPNGFISAGFNPLEVPNAPTIGTAVSASPTSVSVTFTAPSNVGGSAITGYVATARKTSDGTTISGTGSSSPVTISGLTTGTAYTVTVAAVNSFGAGPSSAASNSVTPLEQQLWAWGRNHAGQLGLGDTGNLSSPVQVGSLTTWSQIAGGRNHTLIKTIAGALWGTGYTNLGQLGLGDTAGRSSPVQVGALTTWYQIAAGNQFTVATKTDGTLWSWGQNTYGKLGLGDGGSYTNRSSPVQVGSLTTWYQVASGFGFTLATKTDGTLWSWGQNGNGQLGLISDTYNRSSPVQIGALTTWYQIAVGSSHAIATKTDGTLWSWGRNSEGQCGLGDVALRSSPVQVGVLTTWYQVSAGYFHTVATKTDGTMWSWGGNAQGQLGLGDVASRSSPVQIGVLTTWSRIAGGRYHTLAIKTDGALWSWGRNNYGQLGVGNADNRSSPVQVGALTTWLGLPRMPMSYSSLAIKG